MSPVPVHVFPTGSNTNERRSVSGDIGGFVVLRIPPWTAIVAAASARCACAPDQMFWSGRTAAGWLAGTA